MGWGRPETESLLCTTPRGAASPDTQILFTFSCWKVDHSSCPGIYHSAVRLPPGGWPWGRGCTCPGNMLRTFCQRTPECSRRGLGVPRRVPCPHDHMRSSEEESQSRALLNMAHKAMIQAHPAHWWGTRKPTEYCWGIRATGGWFHQLWSWGLVDHLCLPA